MESTSTAELRRIEEGMINIEVALKVLRKEYRSNVVGKNGNYSKMFLHLVNDEEERVKLVAFGATADRFNSVFEANSLVHFTGLQAQPVYSQDLRFGELAYELKADGNSIPTLLESNYRIRRGMPFSQVKDVDTSRAFARYKLKARLTTDFTPYGDGLSGQAIIEDSSGRLSVYVQILRVSKENKTRFRANSVVALKGSFRKFSTLTRMVIDHDGDIEFQDIFARAACVENVAASPKSISARVGRTKDEDRRCSDTSSGYHSSPSVSTTSFVDCGRSTEALCAGSIVADFSYSSTAECVWGMIMSENAEAFEVFLNDVPDGAETLLIEGEFLRVLGSLNAKNEVKVDRWADVQVKGCELFVSEQDLCEEPTPAIELRKLAEAEVRTVRARLLNIHFTATSASLTSLVEGTSKVVVKIIVNEYSSAFRARDFTASPIHFLASGSIVCTGK
ncbi:hypothetical protein AAVH_04025 [Aphelenchoides avenae]|nr:hypothetical protein AAVH_04025 [Aphelenchus avenae]